MLGLISELIRHSVRLNGTFQLICSWRLKFGLVVQSQVLLHFVPMEGRQHFEWAQVLLHFVPMEGRQHFEWAQVLLHFGVELQLHFQLVQSQVLLHFGVELQLHFQLVQSQVLLHFGVELQLHFQLVQSQVLFHFGPVRFSGVFAQALVNCCGSLLLVRLGFQEVFALSLVVVVLEDQSLVRLGFQEVSALSLVVVSGWLVLFSVEGCPLIPVEGCSLF